MDSRKANEEWSSVRSFAEHGWEDTLSGMVITSGNVHDLGNVPGLRELSTIMYRGVREPKKEDTARVECCTRRNGTYVCEFDCTHYEHAWGDPRWNSANTSNATESSSSEEEASRTWSYDLRKAASLPWWFWAERLVLDLGERERDQDQNETNQTQFWLLSETYTAPSNLSTYRDCALGLQVAGCSGVYASFVSVTELEVAHYQAALNGTNGSNGTFMIDANDTNGKNPANVSSYPPQGCALYNFSSMYFDVFRVHYNVPGWEASLFELSNRVIEW